MSLEKRKEHKESEKQDDFRDSSYRRMDFTPLEQLKSVQINQTVTVEEKKPKVEEIKELYTEEELGQIERDVLEIAEKILKLKRYDAEFEIETTSDAELQKYPIIEKLYAKCIAKLAFNKGYSKDDIFLTIRNLEEKNWIVTNERRTKLEVLNNETLSKILDFIKINPGIHARDEKIEKELGITRTPFLKHIMTLENFNLIRSKKIGKTLHYFSIEVPENLDELKAIFLNPLIPKIIEEFIKNESLSIIDIGEKLDIYSGTIQYQVNKLKELNLIKTSMNQSSKKVHLVDIELLKNYNKIFKEPDFSRLLNGL